MRALWEAAGYEESQVYGAVSASNVCRTLRGGEPRGSTDGEESLRKLFEEATGCKECCGFNVRKTLVQVNKKSISLRSYHQEPIA